MKKFYIILFILVSIVLSSCSNPQDTIQLQSQLEEKDKTILTLQEELETIKEERDKALSDYSDLKNQIDKELEETKLQQEDVTVTVLGKTNIPEDIRNNRFSDRVDFKFSIKNSTDKDIQGIQGVLNINDLFGVNIMNLNCDFVGNIISPNSTVVDESLGFDINEFMDEDVKVYTTDYSNLKFEYKVNKIVFTDGTTKE